MNGKFSKMLKYLLLRNHKGGEAETWHTCLEHYSLPRLWFYPGLIRTLVDMATYIFNTYNEKSEN